MTTAPSHVITPARARAARIGVSAMFFANGAVAASIIPRLPAIKDGLALSNGELGAAVAAMPLGGLLAGGLVGILVGRFGSGRVAMVAGTAAGLTLVGVGVAGSWLALAVAYLVLGMFDATMDASMNAHSIGLQRQYGRSILQGFHGMWSLGSMAAGAMGAIAAGVGVPVSIHLAAAGVRARRHRHPRGPAIPPRVRRGCPRRRRVPRPSTSTRATPRACSACCCRSRCSGSCA